MKPPYTVEVMHKIKELAESGTGATEIARQLGFSSSGVAKIAKSVKDGTFKDRLAWSERWYAPKGDKKPKTSNVGAWSNMSQDQRQRTVTRLKESGMGPSEIAKRFGISVGKITYQFYPKYGKKPQNHKADAPALNGHHPHDFKKVQKIISLKNLGHSYTQISHKTGVGTSVIGYYVNKYGKESPNGESATTNGSTNGSTNGAVNKHVLIGIAYAETERFIGLLGEKLGVSAEILRPRLSELLGHSPLRR